MEVELLVAGGSVVDGTGGPSRRADVAIDRGRIVAVGALTGIRARESIRADGLVVAPGFIDAHAHVEIALLDDGYVAPKVEQGVTTEIVGQDGLSYAPLSPWRLEEQIDYLATLNGRPRTEARWQTWEEYFSLLAGRIAQNVAWLVPWGAIRLEVAGWTDRALDDGEVRRARAAVEAGLADGAVGVGLGLDYFPQTATTTAELDALGAAVAEHGSVLVAHVRGNRLGMVEAVREMVEVARRTGASVHVSHLRDLAVLPVIDEGLADGLDLTFDVYPYRFPSTMLLAHLPAWVLAGGPRAVRERLADPALRPRLAVISPGRSGLSSPGSRSRTWDVGGTRS